MTDRKLYDGINTDARDIAKVIQPGNGVAYYVDGIFAWNSAEIALFPHNWHVTITVLGNPADVADCETGDLTPWQAAAWVVRQKARGYWRPTVYRSFSLMDDIRQATGPLIMGEDWDSWVAHYDDNPNRDYAGEAAKQFHTQSNMDVSEVYDMGWPHRTKPIVVPPNSPSPTTPRWPFGVTLQFGNKGNAVLSLQTALSDSGVYGVRGIDKDGIYGDQTRTAVHNWEAAAQIPQDAGVAGNQVRNSLIHAGLLSADGVPA